MIRAFLLWFANVFIAFSGFIVAFALMPFWFDGAKVLFNAWLVVVIVCCTMRRPPCQYGSYVAWWRDRANWWRRAS